MRCLVFAYSEIGAVAFETLEQLGEKIVGLVTHEDNPGETRWWRSVRELAERRGVPVITPENPNAPEILEWGRGLKPDVIFSFYYRLMLKKPWLEMAPLGAFNLHGSLLPKFRGRAPVNWAIIEDATHTGLTLHEMLERPDAGQILDQAAVPILEQDTAQRVFEKLVPLARVILARTVPLLRDGRAPRRSQNEAEASYFGKRAPADGKIDWRWPARRVHNLVRGLTRPYPGAFAFMDGQKFFIWKGRVSSETSPPPAPGTVQGRASEGIDIACGGGFYTVEEVQQEGAAPQPAAALLKPGKLLDPYTTGE
jgi:methionyl-tRNA formyltransferase